MGKKHASQYANFGWLRKQDNTIHKYCRNQVTIKTIDAVIIEQYIIESSYIQQTINSFIYTLYIFLILVSLMS